MRLCRYRHGQRIAIGFYDEQRIVPLPEAADLFRQATGQRVDLAPTVDLMDFLPPDGPNYGAAKTVAQWMEGSGSRVPSTDWLDAAAVELLVPLPRPNKLLLLAGNYAKHIEEGGGQAAERVETFPYVFMKPPTTTLTDPGAPIRIPRVSPGAIDWELELGVVIGRKCKGVSERDALKYVAGYTVINDISDRRFRPNSGRKKREKDAFFDWLHGKWHDSFCPCGPCVTTADAVPDPQKLRMKLSVNEDVKQDASTGQMIFPVAAVVEFISAFVTLEPGDIISTGTPEGVGNAKGTYLKAGDLIHAWIEGIGRLVSPVVAEA